MTDTNPLAGLSPDTVRSLIAQARLYIDSVTRDYRGTPPERSGGLTGEGYVSGRDVEEWPARLARFREKWEARPVPVREAILARAFPRKCFWINQTQDPSVHGGFVPSGVVENEPGHTPFLGDGKTGSAPWIWGQTLAEAQETCRRENAKTYGLTEVDVAEIVFSSMNASREGGR